MARSFKLLCDFDGVWTNQGPEALHLTAHMTRKLAELRGVSVDKAQQDVNRFVTTMRQEPGEHGWAPDGRISAFIDEDPLCESSALCRLLSVSADPDAVAYRDAVQRVTDLTSFNESCFQQATQEFRTDHPPALVPDAVEILDALASAEVVIVSNSGADKIVGWFQNAGIDASEKAGATVRVRGSAAKWKLGATDQRLQIGDRMIFVDRPRYRQAIEQERPDVIIGDVFSLDLALPHVMRSTNAAGAPSKLVLRSHDHTPDWVTKTRADKAIDAIVSSLSDLPSLLNDWA